MARATLLSSSQLGSYDALKGACKRWLGAAEGVPLHLSCSLMSGIIAQTIIQPVDTCAPPPPAQPSSLPAKICLPPSTRPSCHQFCRSSSSAFFHAREDLFACQRLNRDRWVCRRARTHIMQQGAATSVGAMLRQEGPLWLYRGFSAACWRQGPIMLVQMPLVEQLRLLLGVGAF